MRKAARLAQSRGVGARAVFKVIGRGALVLTFSAAILAGWLMAGVGYAWLALLVVLTLVKGAVRLVSSPTHRAGAVAVL